MKSLDEILRKLPVVDLNNDLIISEYAQIDSYSFGKNAARPLPSGHSARRMGKNDLWIAATASAVRAQLLTTDHNFDHLDGVFVQVDFIDQSLTGADA